MNVKLDPHFSIAQLASIVHHGGDNGVTGSCHELKAFDGESLLVDCGIFQGEDIPEKFDGHGLEHQIIDFDISEIRAVLLTHVHIDHVGRLPYLLAAGYKGPIFCTEASAELLPLVLEDAVKIGFGVKGAKTKAFMKRLKSQLNSVEYGRSLKLEMFRKGEIHVKFKPAGHIMGSAYIEVDMKGKGRSERTVFSGDLGAPYAPLLSAPKSPYGADRVVMESTYGNKCHEGRKERKETLRKVLVSALSNAGTVIIPAFSIGRTQELLYELEELIHRYKNHSLYRHLSWEDLDIVVDSPLANRFTEVYQNLQALWSKEALVKVSSGRHPLSFENLTTINSHKEHLDCVRYLTKTARPAIVLAASGMCAGGRVAHYLKAMLEDLRHDVLFVGYQAAGTPGRAIQTYGPKNGFVEMDGKKYKIRAKVWTIGGYSAHADQKDLVRFISRMQHRPKVVKLIHGEKKSKIALSKRIREACVKH